MLLKLTKYDLKVRYVPGKQQVLSDCSSRAPVINQLGLDNDALAKFRSCTNTDETSQVVMEYVLTGWPADKAQVDELAREYFSYREELSVEDGLLFKNDKLVVPRSMRAGVLDEIHGAHMGESKSLSYARDHIFWPGMSAQVKDRVRSCGICNAFRNQQQKETLKLHDVPGLPWQTVGTDLFEYGVYTYVVVTDFYSKFFELELLRRNTATCLINNLKKVFARYGSLKRLSVITVPSIVIPETYSTVPMNSRCLQKNGVSNILPVSLNIHNQMVQLKGRYKQQNESWRKLLLTEKIHSMAFSNIATHHSKTLVYHQLSSWWVGGLAPWFPNTSDC